MANFCSNCGAAQPDGSPFCAHCGARQAAPAGAPTQANLRPAAATPPADQPPLPPVAASNFNQQSYTQPPSNQQGFQPAPLPQAKKGSGLKILAFLLAFFVLAGAATLGGLYYVAHRLKQAVVEKAASAGVDLNSISSPVTSNTASKIHIYKACDLLPKTDAAAMLGEPIEHIEDQGATCLYYGPAGLSGKLAQEGTANLLNQMQQPGAQVNGNEVADSLSKLMGGLAAQAGAAGTGATAGSSGDVPLLTFVIDGDGKAQMTALTATKAIFGGIGKAASGGTQGFGADIPGLGDRAVRLANLGLNVLQGNTLIRLIPGPVPNANDKTIAIARAILPKL
jgi:hypothetical protein